MRTKLLRPALAFDRNKALTEYLTASLSSARRNKQHPSRCGKCHVQPRFRWEEHIAREWLLQYYCSTLILHLTSAFTQTIANMVTKPSSSWGNIVSFGKCIYSFKTQGLHACPCRCTLMLDSVWACFRHRDYPNYIYQEMTLSLKKPNPTLSLSCHQ